MPGGAVAAIVVLAVFACVFLLVLVCIFKRTGCRLSDALHPRSDGTYLTAIHDEKVHQHGVDGNICALSIVLD
ncbi:hypothetical protein DPMN_076763 [Dreissena polymorpha]|uniref:Uncharacterized protein n=1 Tax=Dreissena polymorpha TaxID=45954 RepID=A0A9D3YJ86_DREPO|nr:hypothetical protein DPMN_076763 [Dreissena polymorpha]